MYEKLQAIREKRANGEKGFTLIELLVVVVIIGILVAIAIPLYLNYKHGAENRAVESDIRNAAPVVEQAYADATPNAYPADNTAFNTLAVHWSNDTTSHTYTLVSATEWCLTAANSHDSFHYDSSVGKVLSGTC